MIHRPNGSLSCVMLPFMPAFSSIPLLVSLDPFSSDMDLIPTTLGFSPSKPSPMFPTIGLFLDSARSLIFQVYQCHWTCQPSNIALVTFSFIYVPSTDLVSLVDYPLGTQSSTTHPIYHCVSYDRLFCSYRAFAISLSSTFVP